MKIETIKTSKREVAKFDDYGAMAFVDYDHETLIHTITIPYKASTKTRLHEIAHCLLGHCINHKNRMPIKQYIAQEIEADEWAYKKCGKALSLNSIIDIAHQAILYGAGSNHTFASSITALAKHNYKLTRQQRTFLWEECRNFEKEKKV